MGNINVNEIIEVAYEISDCNDEGLTDPDEAMRIFSERTGVVLTEDDMIFITAAIKVEFPAQFGRS